MEYRIRPPVLSFLAVFVLLVALMGLESGAPGTRLYAAVGQSTAPGPAAQAVLGGVTSSRAPAVPQGPTATPSVTPAACGGPFDILLAYTDDSPTTLLRGELLAQPNVASVTLFDAYVDTPTLAEMQPYDLVVAMGNLDYYDPVTLGDNLADYHDGGGVVVPVFGSFFGIENYAIRGRWDTEGYSPYTYGSSVTDISVTLGSYDPTHPLMAGVDTLNAIVRVELTPAPGAAEVAAYSDGTSAVAYKTTGAQTSVGLSAYLGDTFNRGTGDYALVIANAAEWLLAGGCPTATSTSGATTVTLGGLNTGAEHSAPPTLAGLVALLLILLGLRHRRR